MSGIVERVRELPALVAGMLPPATDIAGLTDAELLEFLRVVSAASSALEAHGAVAAAVVEQRSARELGAGSLARKAGVRSGAELVQKLTGSSLGDAKKAVRVGALLETARAVAPEHETEAGPVPRSIDALASLSGDWSAPIAVAVRNGWLSPEQGDRVKLGLGAPRDADSAASWRAAVLRLIADCWEGELTAEDLGRAAKALRACLDREWAAENSARLYEQRSLKRSVRSDGMVKYDLLLDPLTDAEIWTPIFRHLAPRLGGPRFMTVEERQRAAELEVDARTNEQLLADTFTAFLTAGVGAPGVLGAYVPTVSIAVTSDELRAAKRGEDARAKGQAPPGPGGIGWLESSSHPIAGFEILTAICTGNRLAALFDESGQALDVTKHERTFSPRQRAAMALRDGGCLAPGCTMPPGACEGHHINPWGNGPGNRRTETRDGVLLCRFHHLNLHNQGGRIERRGSDYWLHWPGREPVKLVPRHGLHMQLQQGDTGSTEL